MPTVWAHLCSALASVAASAGRYVWLPPTGFVTALFATMVGGGGGFLFVPLLVLFYSLTPQEAAATSLAVTVPIALVGGIGHLRRGNVDLRLAALYGVAGIAGAVAGALLSSRTPPAALRKGFGAYAAILAVVMLVTGRRRPRREQAAGGTACTGLGALRALFGLVAGLIAGLFGSSGAAPVLAGLYLSRLPVRAVVGTSGLVVFLISVSGLSGHLLLGRMDLTAALLLSCGAVPGALSGPRLLARIDSMVLEIAYRYVFSALVAAAALVMIFT